MRRYLIAAVLTVLFLADVLAQPDEAPSKELFAWNRLPDEPGARATTGACRGIAGNALISAGGAYVGEEAAIWANDAHVLMRNDMGVLAWTSALELTRPVSNAASVTWDNSVLCIGGLSAEGPISDVVRVDWAGQRIIVSQLAPLPEPLSFAGAGVVGSTLYVAGGRRTPSDPAKTGSFLSLDLDDANAQWHQLESWPGPPRYAAASAVSNDAYYVFGGIQTGVPADTSLEIRYLRDAYRYTADGGWDRLADLTYAAPGWSAVPYGPSHILLFGSPLVQTQADLDRQDHPSADWNNQILAYHTITNTWTDVGRLPVDRVTQPVIRWAEKFVISGEIGQSGAVTHAHYQSASQPTRVRFGALNYFVLAIYFLILIGMGLYFARGEKTESDYFLARRRIPWWAAGLSIFGTQLSAITFMAIPAKAYATDWVYILGQATIVLIAPVVVYWYLPFFRRLGVTTAYEYLEKRFNLAVRLFGSLTFILLQLGRMGVVIFLPALALSAVTGLNIYSAILLMGLLSTFYTALGGMEAVIWSDVLQVVVLLGGALLSLIIITGSLEGGAIGLVSTAAALGKFHTFTWSWDHTTTTVWVVVLGYLLGNLVPYTADQTVVQRYLTTANERLAARSIFTNAALTIPAGLIFFSLGTALFMFYRDNPQSLEPVLQTDAIFPLFIVQQLPAGIAGLLIAGIFAAAMSSLDSSMNSVAAAIVHDFHRRLSPESTSENRLRLARRLTIGLGVLATTIGLLMATIEIESLFDLFLELLGLFGGSLAGLFALGIFTRRANGVGALAGAITSAIVLYLVSAFTQVHFFLYAGIGIATCCAVGYLMSLAFPSSPSPLAGLTVHTQSAVRD